MTPIDVIIAFFSGGLGAFAANMVWHRCRARRQLQVARRMEAHTDIEIHGGDCDHATGADQLVTCVTCGPIGFASDFDGAHELIKGHAQDAVAGKFEEKKGVFSWLRKSKSSYGATSTND